MTDRPILFSGPMVRALLAGTKTQTRRAFKGIEEVRPGYFHVFGSGGGIFCEGDVDVKQWAPSYLRIAVGDRLYVRETWSGIHAFRNTPPAQRESVMTPDGPLLRDDLWFWADGNPDGGDYEKPRPGIHMPRWASRLTLTVTDVRVERLQDCSADDAIAEGVSSTEHWRPKDVEGKPFEDKWWDDATFWANYPQLAYRELWEAINGPGSWEANPWVAAYTFTVQHGNIDQVSP